MYFIAVDAMGLPFLNPYLNAIGAPSFKNGCNFAAAGCTVLPATGSSICPYSLRIQVAQFLRFKALVLELQSECMFFDLQKSQLLFFEGVIENLSIQAKHAITVVS